MSVESQEERAERLDITPGGGKPGILMGLPERAFVAALRNGWEWMQQNPSAWDAIMRHADEVERDQVKQLFAADGRYSEVLIRSGFPTDNAKVPQIVVLVEEEARAEGGGFLADEIFETDEVLLDNDGAEFRAEIRDQMVTISCVANHPDTALYLYRAVDMILLAHDDWFMRDASQGGAGLIRAEWRSGAPLIPDPRAPERLWGRQIKWLVTGFCGSIFPIPAPKTKISVHLQGTTVNGITGKVRVDG